jgi:hypothetical protein
LPGMIGYHGVMWAWMLYLYICNYMREVWVVRDFILLINLSQLR